MKYIFIPKGDYIFVNNEMGTKFYGLIKGLISIHTIRLIPIEEKGKIKNRN